MGWRYQKEGKLKYTDLGFACPMLGNMNKYSPKWWRKMVIFHNTIRKKNHLNTNPKWSSGQIKKKKQLGFPWNKREDFPSQKATNLGVFGDPVFDIEKWWWFCKTARDLHTITAGLEHMARPRSWIYTKFKRGVPSRELTYPTLGKGKSSSKCHFWGIC